MALDTNSWTTREHHKASERYMLSDTIPTNQHHHQQRNHIKIPTKVSILTQTEHTNRFTQTDQSSGNGYSANCLEGTGHKEAAMFDPGMHQQGQGGHQQIYTPVQPGSSDKKETAEKAPTVEFPFCYNVLQKVPTSTNAGSAVPDDKGCYRFEVAQPFSYNYALVNQMSLAAAASTAQFKCDVCGLVFAHLSLLNHHKRIHNTSERFSCETCGSVFGQAMELKAHKQSEHNKKCCNSCGTEVNCEHGKKKAKYVKCGNCQEEENAFHGEIISPDMEAESKEHHPVKRRNMGQVTKCHKCNGSGIIFVGGSRTTVDKPFHCNVCDGAFSRYSSLWSHKRLHSGDKPFKCELCGVTFAKAAYLKNHQRVHTGEKPFKCPVCGMQFSQSPHLKNHERIHSGERPYQCEVCEKTFARHSTLWNHRRIHTGEKPYRCEICGSAFNQATHLKNHAKVHTGEKPHRCDICDVGFSDRFALKRHRNIHEKYGRLASNSETQEENSQQQGRQPCIEELYKCDISTNIAFPGCLSSQDKNGECVASQQRARQPVIDEQLYKCEVGTSIAFPGCSRPRDKNSECGTIEAK